MLIMKKILFITFVLIGNFISVSYGNEIISEKKITNYLSEINIKNEVRKKYDRKSYQHWIDNDNNGCDTRREVLIAESLSKMNSCKDNIGKWLSIYDNKIITNARELDIDHLVSLAEADRSGAYLWDKERKKRFANDLGFDFSLVAVSAESNREKSDKDPSSFKPKFAICEYTYGVIAVKWRWDLTIDRKEMLALKENLASCEDKVFKISKAN